MPWASATGVSCSVLPSIHCWSASATEGVKVDDTVAGFMSSLKASVTEASSSTSTEDAGDVIATVGLVVSGAAGLTASSEDAALGLSNQGNQDSPSRWTSEQAQERAGNPRPGVKPTH